MKVLISLLIFALPAFGIFAAEEIDVTRIVMGGEKPLPVSMSGFSGEVDSVLRFDLAVLGLDFVTPEKAQYLISGRNNGGVEGRVLDAVSKQQLVVKAYSGASARTLAHTLANDFISAIRHSAPIFKSKVAFVVAQGRDAEIYVSDFDGHNALPITHDNSLVKSPAWVPGQLKLLYTSYKSGFADIFSHDLSTGERRVFSHTPGDNFSPVVSRDGRRVAMILTKGGSPDLYVADIDGSNLRQITNTKEDDESSPCWSPDGQKICFVSRYGGRAALYTIPAGGGERHRLNIVGALNATEPDWSPDGRTIVFTSQMGSFNICTVPASGGDATILTEGEDPAWAANSRTVVFTRRAGGRRVLSLLDAPTKRVKDLQQISGSCSQPAWAK